MFKIEITIIASRNISIIIISRPVLTQINNIVNETIDQSIILFFNTVRKIFKKKKIIDRNVCLYK